MANICSNYITLSGPTKDIKKLGGLIEKQDEALLKTFTWFEKGCHYGLVDDLDNASNFIVITSKWGPPIEGYIELSKSFPTLTFAVEYEECGNNVYGKVSFKAGEKFDDITRTEEDFLMENAPQSFNEELDDIAHMPYKRFLKSYLKEIETLEDDVEDIRCVPYIEKAVLKRIEDKDLPLFLNHTWQSDANETEYKRRLGK